MDHDQSHILNYMDKSVEKCFMINETFCGLSGVPTVVMSGSHYFTPHLDLDVIDGPETTSSIDHRIPSNVDQSLENVKMIIIDNETLC